MPPNVRCSGFVRPTFRQDKGPEQLPNLFGLWDVAKFNLAAARQKVHVPMHIELLGVDGERDRTGSPGPLQDALRQPHVDNFVEGHGPPVPIPESLVILDAIGVDPVGCSTERFDTAPDHADNQDAKGYNAAADKERGRV